MKTKINYYDDILKLVIFDLDGVITDTAKYHHLAWSSFAKSLHITLGERMSEKLKGVNRQDSLDIILNEYQISLSKEEKDTIIHKKNLLYQQYLEDLTPFDILEGIYPLINELKNDGKKIAVGSSSKNTTYILNKLNITNLFDTIVTGCDVENAKPSPDIFLLCANRLNINPSSCLVIEDATSGIEAANHAGMHSISVSINPIQNSTLHVSQTCDLSIELIRKII